MSKMILVLGLFAAFGCVYFAFRHEFCASMICAYGGTVCILLVAILTELRDRRDQ